MSETQIRTGSLRGIMMRGPGLAETLLRGHVGPETGP